MRPKVNTDTGKKVDLVPVVNPDVVLDFRREVTRIGWGAQREVSIKVAC